MKLVTKQFKQFNQAQPEGDFFVLGQGVLRFKEAQLTGSGRVRLTWRKWQPLAGKPDGGQVTVDDTALWCPVELARRAPRVAEALLLTPRHQVVPDHQGRRR